jgi:urease accessory protein
VIARTSAVIEPGGVLGELACTPPLTLRQVHGEARDRCELRLVGTAAGPLAGDDLALSLRLRPGARATLRATGASLAQGRVPGEGGTGATSALSVRVDLAERADLVADPGPLVVCRGGRVDVRLELALGHGARVEWHELIVLGRAGEPPGLATVRWDVTRLGRPVLRQFTDLSSPWLTAGRRVLACALISDPARTARTVVAGPRAAAQRVNEHTVLVTVLEDDAARAERLVADLCAQCCGRAAAFWPSSPST